MPTTPHPNAVVLTAPDGCTKYLVEAVEQALDHMDTGAVLAVPGDRFDHADLAEWCLGNGKRLLNPFDGLGDLLVENTPTEMRQAA
ncbi:MAG: hypothetical protein AAFN30_21230 [Actinomycetota bacterium]